MPTFKEQKLQEFEQKFFVDNGNIPAEEYAEVEAFLYAVEAKFGKEDK